MPPRWLSCFTGCSGQDAGNSSSKALQQEQQTQPEDVAHYYSQIYQLGSASQTSSASSVPPEMSSVLIVMDADGQLVPRTRTQPKSPGPSRFSQSPCGSPFAVHAHAEEAAQAGQAAASAEQHTLLQIARQDSAASEYASCNSFFTCSESFAEDIDSEAADTLLPEEWTPASLSATQPATSSSCSGPYTAPTLKHPAQAATQYQELHSTQGHIYTSSSELHSIPAGDGYTGSESHYSSLLASSSLTASKSKELRISSCGSNRTSWHSSLQQATIHFTPEQQQLHVTTLQQMLGLYQQQGNPCAPCRVVWQHCQDTGIQATDLIPIIPLLNQQQQQQQQQQLDSAKPLCSSPEGVAAAPGSTDTDTCQQVVGPMHLTRLLKAVSDMDHCLQHVMSEQGWQVVRDDALQLYYRHQPGTSVHSFKARATVDAPIEHLLALTREFDLCSTWNHHCLESVILHEWSLAELLCCAVLWLPWPLPNASLVVEAVGMDLLETHGGFLVTFSTPKKKVDGHLMKRARMAKPSNMWITILTGSCMYFEPLPGPGGPRTRATVETHTDAGIKLIPGFVITFVLKVMAPFIYNMALKLLTHEFSDPSRPLPSRIPQRPDLYGMVRRHTAAYLRRKAAQAEGAASS